MRRSEINHYIKEAKAFLKDQQFYLPSFADWDLADWQQLDASGREIVDNELGWDLTDYGSGHFEATGLLLFTIRNGNAQNSAYPKPYAEKMLMVREGQETPYHYHWDKMEDIINRGGGNLVVKVYPRSADDGLGDQPLTVTCDGVQREYPAGAEIVLKPGESITLEPYVYHSFWGEAGGGHVLVGEVSKTNDDHADNRFLNDQPRFPEVDEDESPEVYLVSDYDRLSQYWSWMDEGVGHSED